MERINAWKNCDKKKMKEVMAFNEEYRKFLSVCKTERECVKESIRMAEAQGYTDLHAAIAEGKKLKAGDKVYASIMGKSLVLFHIGTKPLEEGMKILGAHVDSPRIDIKQNPLYEDSSLVMMDTHYYGGIKKYQWLALPLALHGVVALKDGSVIDIVIGEDPTDPVFCISDLLPHLAQEQMEKTASKLIDGEALDIIIGSMPVPGKKKSDDKDAKDTAKDYILELLEKKYGFKEEDFLSAELEAVPAGPARDMGFDSSMIMGYGQDDRVCAYTSLVALLKMEKPEKTLVCLLVDKEEIGSVGATGMQSRFFENMVAEVLDRLGCYSELTLRRALSNSQMLSSDVNAAFDPNFPSVFEKKNTSFLGQGLVFSKFTGSRGKSGSNDANAEYIAKLRKALDQDEVAYQMAELGKVDVGGGGTIAYILANYGMEVIDCGVAVLSMHAPYEVTSKIDVYETMRGYVAFMK